MCCAMRGRAALPLRLLLAVLLANMAAECRVSIPHTVVNPRTMSSASPHQTSARQGLNGDNLLVLLKHIPQGKQQLDVLWDDVTNPVSAEYRSFKTASEVLGMIAPAASDVDEVIMWLATRGYDTLQRHGDALTVTMRRKDPPAAALKHDHDRIHQDAAKKKAPRSSENASANSNKKRASSKDAAVHLWATVDPPGGEPTWHPLIEFVVRSKAPYGVHEGSNHRWTRANTGHAPPGIPATTLRDLYSVPTVGSNRGPAAAAAAAPGRGAGIAVANWQGGACLPYPPDVESYCSLSSFEPYRQGHRVRGSQPCKLEVRTKAARNASAACIEADLDSEMLFAAADMTRSVVGANNGTSFLAWAISWFGQKHGPEIATVSWSGSEGSSRPSNSSVELRLNTELQKLGVLGKAIFWASGDVGTGAPSLLPNNTDGVYQCITGKPFAPSFPATSPYVTSCGGTELHNISKVTGGGVGRRLRRRSTSGNSSNNYKKGRSAQTKNSSSLSSSNRNNSSNGNNQVVVGIENGGSRASSGGADKAAVTAATAAAAAAATSAPHASLEPPPICNKVRSGCAHAQGAIERATSLRVSGFSSGGGFSWWFPRPVWQVPHVTNYLHRASATLPPAALWSRTGRGVPDVSSVGGSLVLVTNGAVWLGGGTSAAAPWWGGVWALATAMAKAKTGKPLGPASPLLYHLARTTSCFRDVVEGDNKCPWGPRWEGQVCNCSTCHGFEATVGWDPVTGLGTPNVTCILEEIDKLL